MTVLELAGLLESMGAPVGAYSIGRVRDEAYCLVREHKNWLVFYSERGTRNGELAFRSEAEACHDLIHRLLRNSISRNGIRRPWTRSRHRTHGAEGMPEARPPVNSAAG